METAGKSRTTVAVRMLAFFCYTVAAIVMFTSHQHVHAQSSTLTVKYDEWDGFRLFATVNIIGGVYNLLVPCIGAGSPLWKTVIVLDVVNMRNASYIKFYIEFYNLFCRGCIGYLEEL
ncbi:hypothetical protein OROHE_019400 [Orobanche hederae]